MQAAKGIPAWREPLTVPLIVATGLAEGGGLWLLLASTAGPAPPCRGSPSRWPWRAVWRCGWPGAAACAQRRAHWRRSTVPGRPSRRPRCCPWPCRRWPRASPLPPAALIALQWLAGCAGPGRRAVVQVHAGHAGRLQPGLCAYPSAGARRAAHISAEASGERAWAPSPRAITSPPRSACTRRWRRCRATNWQRCSSTACARCCATPGRHVPWQRARLDAAGLHPDSVSGLDDLQRLPFMVKTDLRDHYPFGLFARPVDGTGARARLVGHDGPAHRGRLHGRRPRPLGRPDGALDGRRRRAARRPGAQRLRLRPVHRRAGRALRRRAPGLPGGADLRRRHRTPGGAADGLRRAACCAPRRPTRWPSPRSPSRWASTCGRAGCASACSAPSRGARRCATRSRPAWVCAPTTSTACPRSWARAWPASACAATGCTAGRTTSCSSSSIPRPARPVPDGEAGELVITTLTKEALPMLRYRTRDITRLAHAALRLRPHAPAHPARDRAQRRHADHPRRQRLPVPDRGRAGRPARPGAALPAGDRTPRQPGSPAHRSRGPARRRTGDLRDAGP